MIRFVFRLLLVVLLLAAGAALGMAWRSGATPPPLDDASLAARLSQISESAASLELLEGHRLEEAKEVLRRGLRESLEEANRLADKVRPGWADELPELREGVRRAADYVRKHDLGSDLVERAEALSAKLGRAASKGYTELVGRRDIAALSAGDIEKLEAGAGMGLALAAELHRYPGPKHVLELAEDLELTPDQLRETERIFAAMNREARRLGKAIVAAERRLDRKFADGKIDEGTLAALTGELGVLNGKLRAVHLAAHLETRALLTAEQVDRYWKLRGYEGAGAGGHDPSIDDGEPAD